MMMLLLLPAQQSPEPLKPYHYLVALEMMMPMTNRSGSWRHQIGIPNAMCDHLFVAKARAPLVGGWLNVETTPSSPKPSGQLKQND